MAIRDVHSFFQGECLKIIKNHLISRHRTTLENLHIALKISENKVRRELKEFETR
jgi:DeoR/GlpR family transcriptional regulator of sugar metabolism